MDLSIEAGTFDSTEMRRRIKRWYPAPPIACNARATRAATMRLSPTSALQGQCCGMSPSSTFGMAMNNGVCRIARVWLATP